MRDFLDRLPYLTDRPLPNRARFLLVASALLLAVAIFVPLWQIHLEAPQYQEGLDLYIYSYTLEGGNAGGDLSEINSLNRYIGMQPIRAKDFTEMRWIPFFLGGFVLLALRAAFLGRVKAVVDLFVLYAYFGVFSIWRFYYRLSTYASDLNPDAPIDVGGFMPALVGKDEVADFTQYGYPREGGILLFVVGLCFAVALWMGVTGTGETEDGPESEDAAA
jgi:copper chaperone NosL